MSRLLSEPRRREDPTPHRVNELSPEMAKLIAGIDSRKKACNSAHRRMRVNVVGNKRFARQ